MNYLAVLCSSLALLAALSPNAAAQNAQIVSAGPEAISVTVYPDNLAMITERRTIDLPKGMVRVSLEGVNDQIIPQTALLTEFGAVSIERNFDYDLLDRASLFESAIGEEVTLIRTLPGSGEVQIDRAKIVSGGVETVFEIDGRIEAYQCSGLAERVEFDERPAQLQAKPTLSLTVETERAGPQTIEFRYLASGFAWKADYILSLADDKRADLQAWLTLSNSTAVSIEDADLSVVSGTLARLGETRPPLIIPDDTLAQCFPKSGSGWQFVDEQIRFPRPEAVLERVVVTGARRKASLADFASPVATREDLGDYKLYRAPYATSLEAQQTKQIAFIDKSRIDYELLYAFDYSDYRPDGGPFDDYGEGNVRHAEARYVIDNSRRGRLSEPLPEGDVRVMDRRADGGAFFIGADSIENLAVEAPVEIDAHFSSTVVMIPIIGENERVGVLAGPDYHRTSIEYVFENRGGERAPVEFSLLLDPRQEIDEPSLSPDQDGARPKWRFTVPANGQTELRFTLINR